MPPHRASTSDFNRIGGTGRKAFTIYIYIYIYMHMHIYIYIYIYCKGLAACAADPVEVTCARTMWWHICVICDVLTGPDYTITNPTVVRFGAFWSHWRAMVAPWGPKGTQGSPKSDFGHILGSFWEPSGSTFGVIFA